MLAGKIVEIVVLVASGDGSHHQVGFEHVKVRAGVGAIGFFVLTAVLAPLAEELLFRGVLFGSLARKMPWVPAAAISATVFGAVHLDAALFPLLAWLGFVDAAVYHRTGNIVTSMILHGINNGVAASIFIFS